MLHWMPPCQSSLQAIISSSTIEGAGGSVPHSTLVLAGVVLLCTGSCTGGRPLSAASDRRILANSATRDGRMPAYSAASEGPRLLLRKPANLAASDGRRPASSAASEASDQWLQANRLPAPQLEGRRASCEFGALLRAATSQNAKKRRGRSVGKKTTKS